MEFLQLGRASDTFTVTDAELPGVERGATGVTYTLRPLSTARYFEIVDQLSEKKWDRRLNRLEKTPPAQEVVHAAVLDWVLVDWTGVHDFQGQPLPCDPETKRLIDAVRSRAIVEVAGANRVESVAQDSADSFRPPPGSPDVVG